MHFATQSRSRPRGFRIAGVLGVAGSLVAGLALLATAQTEADSVDASFTVGGYVETSYSYNAARPENDISALRGYDHRHGMFDLGNAVLDAQWRRGAVSGRVSYQIGTTPATYYLVEPTTPAGGGVSGSDPVLRRGLQQAYAGIPVGSSSTLQAGLFLSPIGPEGIAVKDNWNWSRSNLFFGLPAYHLGARVSRPLNDRWTVTGGVFNGWNSAVDSNDDPSVSLHAVYASSSVSTSVLYFGGNERPNGAPEGKPWRHLLDAHATWTATPRLTLLGHVDLGTEDNRFGASSWTAAALYARYQLATGWYLAARGDVFDETAAKDDAGGSASAIFWPVERVNSGTATLEWRPADAASIRLEARHDRASEPVFFGRHPEGNGVDEPFIPTKDEQTTVTLGITAWM